jgi:hypothetical protein
MTNHDSNGWIVNRSRVRLAGRVTAADGTVATGGVLALTAGEGTSILRQFIARIRSDGFYFFLDLPAGKYLLNGHDQRGNKIETLHVSITAAKGRGSDVVAVDLKASGRPHAGEQTRTAESQAARDTRRETRPEAEQQSTEVSGPPVPVRRRRGSGGTSAGKPHA